MERIDALLRCLVSNGGSDLHVASGRVPRVRRNGKLRPIEDGASIDAPALSSMLEEACPPGVWARFLETRDVDFALGLPGLARFRANYFQQTAGAAAVFRVIPERILSIEDLELPPAVAHLAATERGLVLVTGATGSGKSTTLAAIIDRLNATRARHVVTIEDPVEFVHSPRRCTFSHREVGTHTDGFAGALRAAMRQDADVILVGEMRDPESISLALNAAEMGILVFGTLHTNGAVRTINRLVDAFPPDAQHHARTTLAETLVAVVSQHLVHRKDGKGRCAINEILLWTPALPNLIREGKISMITSTMQAGRALGMQTLDEALIEAVTAERIDAREAYRRATDKPRFARLIDAG